MMGKTHIFIGMASALAISVPSTGDECLAAIMGGAVGGIISDIDIRSNSYCRDALYARFITAGIVLFSFIINFFVGGEIWRSIINTNYVRLSIGISTFLMLCLFGVFQNHREFTHSLIALVLFTVSVGLFCYPIAVPFVIGFLSHLLLDILNKKPIRLLFPKDKGICLKLCYSNKIADKVFMVLGIVGTIFALSYSCFRIF
ncbi:metal-dependent hydrolase [Clostridium sp. HBUAS56010]|uniref:metal-dependent hydrolase n=1 Tax=Clostridium sp. HBUAS56010 TaxID=2571127 RepID=UPI0011779ED0|nr:metal-dependent hydrolase [Clostridium sp. HBUAS56010]